MLLLLALAVSVILARKVILANSAFEQTPLPEVSVNQLVPSPAPALHVSIWWNGVVGERDLDLVRDAGFRWAKQIFSWREIEAEGRGHFNWESADRIVSDARERGLYLLVRLDHEPYWARPADLPPDVPNGPPADFQDFENFCFAVAERYRGRIHAYQVWNEPNLAREWSGRAPDPVEYTRLLAHCYNGIKRADPDAIVISAGLAPTGTSLPVAIPDEDFLRGMYEAGAAEYFDMLGLNAPGYAAPPEASPDLVAATPEWGGYRWAAFRHVEDMRQIMLAYGDGSKQIAILEMGWTTDPINPDYHWFAVTPQQQAEYLTSAYWWARQHWQPWIGIMSTVYIPDHHWRPLDEQYWWGITVPSWPRTVYRPAYYALQSLPAWDHEFYEQSDRFIP